MIQCKQDESRCQTDARQQLILSNCGIIVCDIMKYFVLKEEVQDTISDEDCNKIRAEILEAFITDEEGSWQSQYAEDIRREETSSKMKRKRGQSSSRMKEIQAE
ncbi:hypothetical protein RHMOL_Rhmol13G0131700 [Rhododendron molle]|uniref:Uncharacterized protein n=1 Tax=Rhododendron molle TaxID=49168 RepID=A0ACC0L744_RHOML|nr:hypothetical protein RHMOL_Rhmol13G0131700 [Rhododendron molle]